MVTLSNRYNIINMLNTEAISELQQYINKLNTLYELSNEKNVLPLTILNIHNSNIDDIRLIY